MYRWPYFIKSLMTDSVTLTRVTDSLVGDMALSIARVHKALIVSVDSGCRCLGLMLARLVNDKVVNDTC